ncbi:diguanylate cyclase domain-containing protein [Ramlibacter alkalitolerans]|uniref:Diguanylate cyclase n=1 Tax=Ramlibacter alkalitolerans TaxID=2039631 RepID=A0ABS1JLF5_9BURK|nr:diguanylate cyclase [Ramlibacter alkalitolerans]MBL0425006.1 diguanylate cyclase [Ramlibacter alkalitolerans]
MDTLAAGFWGAFFCTATMMLIISLAAFVRSHRRVALMAALTSIASAGFVVAYLGWLPIDGKLEARVLAHVAVATAVSLGLMLTSTMGMLRQRAVGYRVVGALVGAGVAVVVAGWALEAEEALALSSITAFAVGAVMLVVAMRGARRGDRAGWTFVAGIFFMLVAIAGLSWIALTRTRAWPVHAISAVAGCAYLSVVASVLWARYSYLLELAEVMAHGPSYDPVTRMRSHSETGQMVGEVFFRRSAEVRPIGVLAICVANLYALENLHGRAAFNHALFVTAGRLRRCVPPNVEMGRLSEDGFLLVVPYTADVQRLGLLARTIRDRIMRPVTLSTSRDPAGLEAGDTSWVAEVGIGVLGTSTHVRPSQVVGTARAMARTAWSYAGRLAYFDKEAEQIAELVLDEAAAPEPPQAMAA